MYKRMVELTKRTPIRGRLSRDEKVKLVGFRIDETDAKDTDLRGRVSRDEKVGNLWAFESTK